ncbi:nephrin-like isoform X2 [Oratosquilla oratoria]|uniref:nephrin-like isoform X2 n=1 Tax=Oratosquilla oratoria TaxID=337810 RepID=UPI003F76D42B
MRDPSHRRIPTGSRSSTLSSSSSSSLSYNQPANLEGHPHMIRCSSSSSSSSASIRLLAPFTRLPVLPWLLLLLVLAVPSPLVSSEISEVPIEGVTGQGAKLPCRVIQERQEDSPVLVLWYKDGGRLPFYTLDLRTGSGDGREEFFDPSVKGRASSDFTGSHMHLKPLHRQDSGQYRCRVDFENSPTLSAYVNVTVYEPPSRLVIQNANRRSVRGGVLGQLREGDELILFCIASGGYPSPTVTWWAGRRMLSNQSHIVADDGTLLASQPMPSSDATKSHVISKLRIPSLSREDSKEKLECKAANNNITEPISTSVTLDIYLRPSSVRIKEPRDHLQEDVESNIECQATGSYPSANIIWEITHGTTSTKLEATDRVIADMTSSILNLSPTWKDHGATLTCRAYNPHIKGQGLHDSVILQVRFAPRVKLHLGRSLLSHPINEGEDVYFECEVSCNPPLKRFVWHRNGFKVVSNQTAGILITNMDLVLQRVHRSAAGNYTCTATNELGTATSNSVSLPIRYFPVCSTPPMVRAVAEGESVRLTCKVDARPSNALQFMWYFNNTLDTVEVDKDRVVVTGATSYLDYTPRSARDYGMLACWATNSVGPQAEPCWFTVTEAGPPEPVRNCVLMNQTMGSLEVKCTEGEDGGLEQRFVANVYNARTHELQATLNALSPRFHVAGLEPNQDYAVTIKAVNKKGESETVQIDAITLKVAEKRMVDVDVSPVSPLVGVFLGLIGGFVLLLTAGIILTRARANRCNCLRSRENDRGSPSSGVPTGATTASSTVSLPTKKSVERLRDSRKCNDNEDEEGEGPDVVKIATAQLLKGPKPPEVISSSTSMVGGFSCAGLAGTLRHQQQQPQLHHPQQQPQPQPQQQEHMQHPGNKGGGHPSSNGSALMYRAGDASPYHLHRDESFV